MYDYFPENVRNMLKYDFVFVSYCQENEKITANVNKLVKALRNDGINVIYDEGGTLQAATNIQLFMNLIYDKKCKMVLVIIDNEYVKKVEVQDGGVFTEYKLIAGDISKNPIKYIPIKADDSMLDIFKPELYLKLKSCSTDEVRKISEALVSCRIEDKEDDFFENVEEHINNGAYEVVYYMVDPKIILEAIERIDETKLYIMLKILNYRLIALLYLKKVDEYEETIQCIEKAINIMKNKKIEIDEQIYYLNICLCYRELEFSFDMKKEYVRFAKLAYVSAKNNNSSDIYDYELMYSAALYESKMFKEALDVANQAYTEFNSMVSSGKVEDNALKKMKLLTNLAEINRCVGKKYKQRKKLRKHIKNQ